MYYKLKQVCMRKLIAVFFKAILTSCVSGRRLMCVRAMARWSCFYRITLASTNGDQTRNESKNYCCHTVAVTSRLSPWNSIAYAADSWWSHVVHYSNRYYCHYYSKYSNYTSFFSPLQKKSIICAVVFSVAFSLVCLNLPVYIILSDHFYIFLFSQLFLHMSSSVQN